MPLLSRIPIIGPVLFRQTILVYLMYAAVAVLSVMLFRSRWGLRLRACGEHPKAADTVGINVMHTRVTNLALAGALAGLGGAFFTVGSGLSFENDMTAGNGYIALAAMILGRYHPVGALLAALTTLATWVLAIGSPVPSTRAGCSWCSAPTTSASRCEADVSRMPRPSRSPHAATWPNPPPAPRS